MESLNSPAETEVHVNIRVTQDVHKSKVLSSFTLISATYVFQYCILTCLIFNTYCFFQVTGRTKTLTSSRMPRVPLNSIL